MTTKPMSLAVALAQREQAERDVQMALDAALEQEPAQMQLTLSMILTNIRSTQRSGWTDGGRASLSRAAELCKAALGVE